MIRPGFISTEFADAAQANAAETVADFGPYAPYVESAQSDQTKLRSWAGTPDNVVARLNEVLPDALASQPVKELIAKQGGLVTFAGPQAFSAQIARELEIERALVKRLGLLEKQ